MGWGSTGGQSLVRVETVLAWYLQVEGVGRCWHGTCYVCDKVGLRGGHGDTPFAVKLPHIRYTWKWLIL